MRRWFDSTRTRITYPGALRSTRGGRRHRTVETMSEPRFTDEELAFLREVFDLARAGSTAELATVLDRGVPANLTNSGGDTLLILAAYHDHPETVRMLLEHGAAPDRVNDRGQTALGAAVFRRSRESVTLLLGHGADARAGERSALQIAEFFGLREMAELLRGRR